MDEESRNKLIDRLSDDLRETSNFYVEVMKEIENEQEAYWNSLSKEDQLKAFCAVSRRIHQAEILDQGTYRHALYGVFGFGPESYTQGMDCGYMAIHNSIMPDDHDEKLLKAFCEKYEISNREEKVSEFLEFKWSQFIWP
jgi:hypothetical protein